jgi:hypothetical protein
LLAHIATDLPQNRTKTLRLLNGWWRVLDRDLLRKARRRMMQLGRIECTKPEIIGLASMHIIDGRLRALPCDPSKEKWGHFFVIL